MSSSAPPFDLTPIQLEILEAASHDSSLKVLDGAILAVTSHLSFKGGDYVRAFRSLNVQNYVKWVGHSLSGGELYQITAAGRQALAAARPRGQGGP